jgi:hypothetical protein
MLANDELLSVVDALAGRCVYLEDDKNSEIGLGIRDYRARAGVP